MRGCFDEWHSNAIRQLISNGAVFSRKFIISGTQCEAMIHLDCEFAPDVVIADWDLKDGTFGSALLAVVKERFPRARRLLVSGNGSENGETPG
jgi:hypothetical protein